MFNYLLDIIYPKRCPVCDKIINENRLIHDECRDKIHFIDENACIKCGSKMDNYDELICYNCSKINHIFDRGFSVLSYDSDIKKSLYRFKYSKRAEYAKFYANIIEEKLINLNLNIDLIIPVPIHKKRKSLRGYNQAELIARILSKNIGVKCDSNILVRIKNTQAQKNLTVTERKINLFNSIKIKKPIDVGINILLVDDIYTTGATIDACSKQLRKYRVENIYFITLAS